MGAGESKSSEAFHVLMVFFSFSFFSFSFSFFFPTEIIHLVPAPRSKRIRLPQRLALSPSLIILWPLTARVW